jgi:outer membrane lipoprotein-sorting protein
MKIVTRISIAAMLGLWLGLAALPTVPSVQAAPPAEATLSQQDRRDIERIEQYLNSIRTVRSQFVQATNDGTLLRGTFWMSRPGKMRLEYDPPIRNFVVADGWFVFYWDDELKQQSSAPVGSTLADVILRDRLTLSGDTTVSDVERGPGTLEVTVTETKDPGKGKLTLIFEDNPLRLRKWRILDPQGLTTEVALLNPQFGMTLDRDLFIFKDPTLNDRRD